VRYVQGEKGQVLVQRDVPTTAGLVPVGVVVLLALGSGLVLFVGLGLLAWAFGWSVRVALAGAGGVIVLVWLFLVVQVRSFLVARETVRQVATVPAALPERAGVSVEVVQPEQGRFRYLDLPGSADELAELARGVLSGRTLSEAEWTGAGRPYSRAEFRELRSQLIERGLASWRNERAPSQGVELTRVGEHVFRRLAEGTRTHAHARDGGSFVALPREE
jgi:hypothetical protein